jgi:RNA polymerase sigma-70 factor, ECF subfamily
VREDDDGCAVRETFEILLEALPAEFREVIVLRDVEGLSYKEIAAALSVPIGTVMSRISRGRERLLASLKTTAPMEVLR